MAGKGLPSERRHSLKPDQLRTELSELAWRSSILRFAEALGTAGIGKLRPIGNCAALPLLLRPYCRLFCRGAADRGGTLGEEVMVVQSAVELTADFGGFGAVGGTAT